MQRAAVAHFILRGSHTADQADRHHLTARRPAGALANVSRGRGDLGDPVVEGWILKSARGHGWPRPNASSVVRSRRRRRRHTASSTLAENCGARAPWHQDVCSGAAMGAGPPARRRWSLGPQELASGHQRPMHAPTALLAGTWTSTRRHRAGSIRRVACSVTASDARIDRSMETQTCVGLQVIHLCQDPTVPRTTCARCRRSTFHVEPHTERLAQHRSAPGYDLPQSGAGRAPPSSTVRRTVLASRRTFARS